MAKRVEISNGPSAVVDDVDLATVHEYRWFRAGTNGIVYRSRLTGERYRSRKVYLHLEVFDKQPRRNWCGHHVNGDRSDNRRQNLVWTTLAQCNSPGSPRGAPRDPDMSNLWSRCRLLEVQIPEQSNLPTLRSCIYLDVMNSYAAIRPHMVLEIGGF